MIAQLSSRSLDEVYRLMRLDDAPQPAAHVACVPVYDTARVLEWIGARKRRGGPG